MPGDLSRAELLAELADHLRGFYYYPEGTVVINVFQRDYPDAFDHQLAFPPEWLDDDLRDPKNVHEGGRVLRVDDGMDDEGRRRPRIVLLAPEQVSLLRQQRPPQRQPTRRQSVRMPLPDRRDHVARRGPSRERPGRRARPPARAPARSGDDPPPADRLARPSEQDGAA
jgi:hypothetical protein